MRLVVARCRVDYSGRLSVHLPSAVRLLLVKADGSVSVHADGRAYKPLCWMSPPCALSVADGVWRVSNRAGEVLAIELEELLHDSTHVFDPDPGPVKDGAEAQLASWLADHPEVLGPGMSLVRREHPTDIGPVDLLCRDAQGYVAVEIKRCADIAAVEQLSRYLRRMSEDPLVRPLRGVLAAREVRPNARVLATERAITCVRCAESDPVGPPAVPTLF